MVEMELVTETIETILRERGQRYGDFPTHATITHNIKRAMRRSPNWETLSDDKKECLEMVAHKIARILNGDPEWKDSWADIAGYAKLVADTLEEPEDAVMVEHYCVAEKSSMRVQKGKPCNWCAKVVS